MKDEPVRYLYLDVHRSTVVASVRDEQGQVVMKATVATDEKAIMTLVKSAGPPVHVAFEEGMQAKWLHDLLLAVAGEKLAGVALAHNYSKCFVNDFSQSPAAVMLCLKPHSHCIPAVNPIRWPREKIGIEK